VSGDRAAQVALVEPIPIAFDNDLLR